MNAADFFTGRSLEFQLKVNILSFNMLWLHTGLTGILERVTYPLSVLLVDPEYIISQEQLRSELRFKEH